MVLRMENFNIFGVHWKIQLLGEGGLEKPIYREGLPKKGGGPWTDCWFKGGGAWQERGGGVFEKGGGLIP